MKLQRSIAMTVNPRTPPIFGGSVYLVERNLIDRSTAS